MKKSLPFLLALLLTGCDFSQFFLTKPVVEPQNNTMCIFGQVVDRFNQPLPGAQVTNGADLFTTKAVEASVDLGQDNGGTINLPPGYFVLRNVPVGSTNEGSATIHATFDGISSTPVSVRLVKRTTNYRTKVTANKSRHLMDTDTGEILTEEIDNLQSNYNVALLDLNSGDAEHALPIAVEGPIQSNDTRARACVRYLGADDGYSREVSPATVTAEIATDSVKQYTPADGVIKLVLQSPPGGSGVTISAYNIQFTDTANNKILSAFTKYALSIPVIVMPAPAYESGPKAYIPIDTTKYDWPTKVAGLNNNTKTPITATVTLTQNSNSPVQYLQRGIDGSNQPTSLSIDILLKSKTGN